MRLHDLTVTAFGPFPGTERVDFDALNDAGLFLLAGATGAGKTSILDAVCFALYGQVPGVRGVKALKSQHAGDEAHPEVVLEFSVRDRRFVVRRSPEWTRPKRRGEGTATEKARATLVEIRPDGEHFLSYRAAEVGQLVADLVGMQAAQFQQVAMLPQGEFQRFLQASSQDRHDVLQRLFHTDRFARIEEWVADHSRQRRDRSAAGQSAVQRLVDSLAERAGAEVPAALSPDGLVAAATGDEVRPWAAALVEEAAVAERAAHDSHTRAATAAMDARTRLDDARRLHVVHQRRRDAQRVLDTLRAESDPVAEAIAGLDAHRRATSCLPALAVLDRARGEADQAADAAGRAVDAATARGVRAEAELDEPWAATVAALRDASGRAEALVPLLEDAEATRRAVAGSRDRLAAAGRTRDDAAALHESLPARRAETRTALDEARADAARVDALSLQLASARQRARAAADLPAARKAFDRLDEATRDARDRSADARDRMQDLLQRRLDGIAAELAGRLSDGEPCLVCGATDHPAPAAPSAGAVTAAEHDAAGAAFDAAQREHADLVGARADAERQAASLRELAAGRDAAAWAADVDALRSALDDAKQAATRATALEAALAELEAQLAESDRDLRAAELRVAELTETVRADEARATRAAEAVADAWYAQDVGVDTLPDLVARVRDDLAAAERAQQAAAAAATATARVAEVERQARDAAEAQGFGGVDAVRAAVLTDHRRDDLERLLADHARREAGARAVLDDPDTTALGDAPVPDLAALEATGEAADADARGAARSYHHAEQRHAALRSLAARLDEALEAWAPARDDYVLAESMSRLVRGMAGDNQLQMRLSSYVLATRLDQVLDAANERLSHLRDQRYLLQRTGRATRRGSQAGLGLEVVDQWTGDVRDPATLSGGETFVVSLSLALGLADVVTHEAGGTEIETLFVDEGFGTLDADTLDDVMDRLDGLRAGGRTVGVVSHVTELRSRIPVQLHVDKTPSGSSIRAQALVG